MTTTTAPVERDALAERLLEELEGSIPETDRARSLSPPLPAEFDSRPGPRWIIRQHVSGGKVNHGSLAPIGDRRLRQPGMTTLCRLENDWLHTMREVFNPDGAKACHTCAAIFSTLPARPYPEPTKTCKECGQTKPLIDGFWQETRYRDLSNPACVSCASDKMSKGYAWRRMADLREPRPWWPEAYIEWHAQRLAEAVTEINRWFPPSSGRALRCPDGHRMQATAVEQYLRLVCPEGHISDVPADLIRLGETLAQLDDSTIGLLGIAPGAGEDGERLH